MNKHPTDSHKMKYETEAKTNNAFALSSVFFDFGFETERFESNKCNLTPIVKNAYSRNNGFSMFWKEEEVENCTKKREEKKDIPMQYKVRTNPH